MAVNDATTTYGLDKASWQSYCNDLASGPEYFKRVKEGVNFHISRCDQDFNTRSIECRSLQSKPNQLLRIHKQKKTTNQLQKRKSCKSENEVQWVC